MRISVFEFVDVDHDGTITKEEFPKFIDWFQDFKNNFRKNYVNIFNVNMIEELWERYDIDKSNTLDFTELRKVLHHLITNSNDLNNVFGEITENDTKPLVEKLLKRIENKYFLLKKFENEKDYALNKDQFNEFFKWFAQLSNTEDEYNLKEIRAKN
eukprot:UN31288